MTKLPEKSGEKTTAQRARWLCDFCGSDNTEARERVFYEQGNLGIYAWRKYRCLDCRKHFETIEVYRRSLERLETEDGKTEPSAS